MDIIEYAEKVLGVQPDEYQKKILIKLSSMPPDRKILISPPRRSLYYRGITTACEVLRAKGETK